MHKRNSRFLLIFVLAAISACSSLPQQPIEPDTEPAAVSAPAIQGNDRASSVALQALAYLGTPYRAGGLSPRTGFDCSGLVAYVYRESTGLALPHNTYELSRIGEPVARRALRPGDLLFYDTQRRAYSHVGIYLGEGRFIHAPSSGGAVRIADLHARYWMHRYNGARRIIGTSS